VLDQSLGDTQVPSGTVKTSDGRAELSSPGGYLVCAWLLNGWSNATNPPTVAGPQQATVKVVRPLLLRGQTSQRRSITITVATAQRLVTDIDYTDHLSCKGTPRFGDGELWNGSWTANFQAGNLGPARIAGTGALRIKLAGNPNHTFELTGLLRGRQLTGTFEEQGKVSAFTDNADQAFLCSSGVVHFAVNAS